MYLHVLCTSLYVHVMNLKTSDIMGVGVEYNERSRVVPAWLACWLVGKDIPMHSLVTATPQ